MCTVKRLRGEKKSMSGRFSSARLKAGKSADPDQKAWSFIRQLNEAAGTKPDRIALEDGARQISYRDMYRHWERYAAVFTSLGMTEKEKARVGLLGATAVETVLAFYGLDMVGAGISIIPSYSAFSPAKILRVIEEEHLTDIIITDDFAQANLVRRLLSQKDQLGLNNVVLLHVPASLLQKLLAIDASPEDLEKLQCFLDNFFDKIPN